MVEMKLREGILIVLRCCFCFSKDSTFKTIDWSGSREFLEEDQCPQLSAVSRLSGLAIRGQLQVSFLSLLFRGLNHSRKGLSLTRASFRRFEGDLFFDNMYFFARKAVTAYAEEDVFGLFLDNEVRV